MIVVSAVSLLLIVTLITVIIIQCLLILRMRKSKDALHSSNETYAESSMNVDVPTTPNEAYTLHKITRPSEEVLALALCFVVIAYLTAIMQPFFVSSDY